jgi:alkanesulfonate monooxygenase SsuD/methylene tetrahydromethanopterin reductase-like flavin-dependent oxidoreductase (luciferase family)
MGLKFDRPGQRIHKLEEVIGLFRAQFSGTEIECAGEFVNVHGYAGRPPPVQRPHPPIMVGGGGRRVLTLAGREADIVSISNVPFIARNEAGLDPQAEAQRRISYVQDAAGERFADLEVESSPFFVDVTDDGEAALAKLASTTGIAADILRDHPNVLVGSVEAIVETLYSRRELLGINYVTVQQARAGAFAAVVAVLRDR